MAKRMLIDSTHPEETRVAVISGNRLEEFDFESARKKQIKGNVYLAKVTRVEPSLQACFVEYGGNRHGFLAFNEIHPDYYRIPVADREALNRMVAEAMAAQDDDEEEEQRRPRWRRRGRRHSGDSGEGSVSGGEDPFPAGEAAASSEGATESVPGDDSLRDEPAALDMAQGDRTTSEPIEGPTDEPSPPRDEAGPIAGDAPPPSAGYDEPRYSDDAITREPEPEDREPDSREAVSSEPVSSATLPGESNSGEPFSGEPVAADRYPSIEEATVNPDAPPVAPAEGSGTGPVEVRAAEETVETVGGDEVEDIRRRHRIWQRRYKIQEVIRKRQILLVQVAKEERGNKGAALTTYISLAGRYCVLMPNTPRGGGISRKITSQADRKRLKEIVGEMEVPDGMAVIVRTAGMERNKQELRRDLDFLLKTWEGIREKALNSTAPALIYEEANLIKRAVRDLYTKDVEEIIVDGEEGFEAARSFMKLLMPNHIKKVVAYSDKQIPLFHRYQVESQIDNMHSPSVQLRSGGYVVLNPTEALVAIDVNSGRSTRERNIEETATRTNLEAADEIARQLRLRDLAGLIVIDFIDMEEGRNRHAVERRLKEALRQDRARIQVGRISPFGLLEMSRQRLRPSLVEASMMQCPHCLGAGYVRSTESMALTVLRACEEEGLRQRSAEITVAVPNSVALYIFNQKRSALAEIEQRHDFRVVLQPDDTIGLSTYRILRSVPKTAESRPVAPATEARADEREPISDHQVERLSEEPAEGAPPDEGEETSAPEGEDAAPQESERREGEARNGHGRDGEQRDGQGERRGRRRGRRGGRRRRGRHQNGDRAPAQEQEQDQPRESTLGPFGEEANAPSQHAAPSHGEERGHEERDQDGPGGEQHGEHRGNEGRGREGGNGERAYSDPPPAELRAYEHAEASPPPRSEERDVSPPAREPRVESAAPAAAAPAAEPTAPEPQPTPPTEPAAPPRRGWWNFRRS